MNSVSIIGRLGRDPEIRYGSSGSALLQVSIAIPKREKKGSEWVDARVWVDCKAFEKTAENMAQYLAKGDEVAIEGRLDLEEWEAKDGSGKRSKLVVLVNRCDFLRKKDGAANGQPRPQRQAPAPAASGASPDGNGFIDDDLPF